MTPFPEYIVSEEQIARREKLIASRPAPELILEAELRRQNILFEPQVIVFGFFVDFQILPFKLAVEVDGHHHVRTRQYDDKRLRILLQYGWSVLRFHDKEVKKDMAMICEKIVQAIRELETDPGYLLVRWVPDHIGGKNEVSEVVAHFRRAERKA